MKPSAKKTESSGASHAILISGASSGVGAAICQQLSSEYNLILLARSDDKMKRVQSELHDPERHRIISLDLQNPEFEQGLNQFLDSEGIESLSGLINNAGIFVRKPLKDTDLTNWRDQFATNFFGAIRLTNCLLPKLSNHQGPRCILNISSTLGTKPVPDTGAYSATKAALNSWTSSLALELAPQGIRVNAVLPGLIETPLHDFYGTDDPKTREQLDSLQPLGKIGQPEHIASAVKFLMSSESEWTTGSQWVVDGGISLL